MLEFGSPEAGDHEPGVVPVLGDGAVVATIRAKGEWRPATTAVIDGQEWVYTAKWRQARGHLTKDPHDVVRYRANLTTVLRDNWRIDLEGTPMEARSSWLGSDHRYLVGGKVVATSTTVAHRIQLHGGAGLTRPQLVFLLWLDAYARRRGAGGWVGF